MASLIKHNSSSIIFLTIGLLVIAFVREDEQNFVNENNWLLFLQILITFFGHLSIKKRTIARRVKTPEKYFVRIDEFKKEIILSPNIALPSLVILMFIFMGVFLLTIKGGLIVGFILLISSLILAVFVAIVYKHPTKLILTEQSIKYEDVFTKYTSSWNDIADISTYYGGTDFLMFSKVKHESFLSGAYFYHGINLTDIDKRWKTREIGNIIKQNAPYLEFNN